MYYKFDVNDEIIEKSEEPMDGENVAYCSEDFDLDLFRVIIGFINDDGEILKHTKIVRSAELVAQKISQLREEQMLTEIEIDYRLSVVELEVV